MTEFDSVKTIMLNMSFSEIVELSKENAELRKKIEKQKMLIDAFKMRESFANNAASKRKRMRVF